jgi:hypothetical protein
MTLQIGTTFPNITTAKQAIKLYIAANSETAKTLYSDKTRFDLGCKSITCTFRIRAYQSKKNGTLITHLSDYTVKTRYKDTLYPRV